MTSVASVGHELDAPPWRRVESTLMATSRALRRAYDVRMAETGLNLSEASLLVFVHEHGAASQSQLAERLDMNRASAGSVVDSLQRRGLVERRPDPGDRRVWLVAPTEAARPLIERIAAIDRRLRDELRAGIGRDERSQLARTLVRLQHNLAAILGDEPAS